jgi:WhiB family transcriptional regulator, redox-sensing transcriptional regulator
MTSPDHDQWLLDIARRLDRLSQVPLAVLEQIVLRDGSCMRLFTSDALPWHAEHLTDRDLAARLCAGCPVQDECLELELRMADLDTVGVWGALPEDDRRALHPYWRQRGNRADGIGAARGSQGGSRP